MEKQVKNEKLIEEYHQRNSKWEGKTQDQLSYFNNLILTLSVGFISFSYKDLIEINLDFTLYNNINWKYTFMTISLLGMTFSIYKALLTSLNRLMDFRITHMVVQIRKRMLEHSSIMMEENTPQTYQWIKRIMLAWKVLKNNYPEISIEKCKKFNDLKPEEQGNIKDNFIELRTISKNLGITTWKNTLWQIFFFGISIIIYTLGVICG